MHGNVYITEGEKEIIDTFPFQRLHRLRQLAGAEYVYPGANHTRIEHTVGVLYLEGKVAENPNIAQRVSEDEAEIVRIAALLHDVGHGPFSHVFEYLLDKELGKTHEDMTLWIITNSELKEILNKIGYNPREIGKLAIGTLQKPKKLS